MFVILFAVIGFMIWITFSVISENIKENKKRKSNYYFLENAYTENTKTINELKADYQKLQKENENYKSMYYQIMNAKDIMSILKILDDNESPDITKKKLSKLWDVLPYYPPDWSIRKWIVKRRDNYKCQKCGKDLHYSKEGIGEVHHIKPLSIGGTNEIKNLILLCHDCHKKVHDEMFDFSFSRDERETLYDDWTYYKIFRQDPFHSNEIAPDKRQLLKFDSYIDDEPDTDKYYNCSYWENKLDDEE